MGGPSNGKGESNNGSPLCSHLKTSYPNLASRKLLAHHMDNGLRKSVGKRSKRQSSIHRSNFIAERRLCHQFVCWHIGAKGYEEVYTGFQAMKIDRLFKVQGWSDVDLIWIRYLLVIISQKSCFRKLYFFQLCIQLLPECLMEAYGRIVV